MTTANPPAEGPRLPAARRQTAAMASGSLGQEEHLVGPPALDVRRVDPRRWAKHVWPRRVAGDDDAGDDALQLLRLAEAISSTTAGSLWRGPALRAPAAPGDQSGEAAPVRPSA
jgi:hypothetical protein